MARKINSFSEPSVKDNFMKIKHSRTLAERFVKVLSENISAVIFRGNYTEGSLENEIIKELISKSGIECSSFSKICNDKKRLVLDIDLREENQVIKLYHTKYGELARIIDMLVVKKKSQSNLQILLSKIVRMLEYDVTLNLDNLNAVDMDISDIFRFVGTMEVYSDTLQYYYIGKVEESLGNFRHESDSKLKLNLISENKALLTCKDFSFEKEFNMDITSKEFMASICLTLKDWFRKL